MLGMGDARRVNSVGAGYTAQQQVQEGAAQGVAQRLENFMQYLAGQERAGTWFKGMTVVPGGHHTEKDASDASGFSSDEQDVGVDNYGNKTATTTAPEDAVDWDQVLDEAYDDMNKGETAPEVALSPEQLAMLEEALEDLGAQQVNIPQAPQQCMDSSMQSLMKLIDNPAVVKIMAQTAQQEFIARVQSYLDDPQKTREDLLQEVRFAGSISKNFSRIFDIPYTLEEIGVSADEQKSLLQHPHLLGLLPVALVYACSQSKEVFAWIKGRTASSMEETVLGLFFMEPGCLFAMIEEACPDSIAQFKENMRQDLRQSVQVPLEPMPQEEADAYVARRLSALSGTDWLSGLGDLQHMVQEVQAHREEAKQQEKRVEDLLSQLRQALQQVPEAEALRMVDAGNKAYQAMCKGREENVDLYRRNPEALRQHFVQLYREEPQTEAAVRDKYRALPLDSMIWEELLKSADAPVNFSVATIHAFSAIPEALVVAREKRLSLEEIVLQRSLRDTLGEPLYAQVNQCRAEYLVNNFYGKR